MEKVHIPPHVTTTIFEDSIVLLDSRKNAYYALKDSAAEFWKALEKSGSTDLALKEVLDIYTDLKDVVKKDMENFIHSLVQAGLLERSHSNA